MTTTHHPFNSEVDAAEYAEWLDSIEQDAAEREELRAACEESF